VVLNVLLEYPLSPLSVYFLDWNKVSGKLRARFSSSVSDIIVSWPNSKSWSLLNR
jgi:hypothetical protein